MSSLWQQSATTWEPMPIESDLADGNVRLARFGNASDSGVALLARPGVEVRVNGLPVVAGLCVLQHRDEVLVDGRRYWFSAESTPVITAFRLAEGGRRPTCPVCRGPVKDGELAVQCPGCGRWFHQIEAAEGRRGRTCWTYAPTCRFCNHPTALTGESSWRPEMEERCELAR